MRLATAVLCVSMAVPGLSGNRGDDVTERERAALVKIRAHTGYLPDASYNLLAGLLASIERIADDALRAAPAPPEKGWEDIDGENADYRNCVGNCD